VYLVQLARRRKNRGAETRGAALELVAIFFGGKSAERALD
jgi:hypothetical protein